MSFSRIQEHREGSGRQGGGGGGELEMDDFLMFVNFLLGHSVPLVFFEGEDFHPLTTGLSTQTTVPKRSGIISRTPPSGHCSVECWQCNRRTAAGSWPRSSEYHGFCKQGFQCRAPTACALSSSRQRQQQEQQRHFNNYQRGDNTACGRQARRLLGSTLSPVPAAGARRCLSRQVHGNIP